MKAMPLFVTLVTLGLAACAGPERRDDARRTDPRLANAPTANEPSPHRNCVRESGSRVPRREGECVPVPGQVLTGEDLLRTGSPDLGSALRRATPYVR